ncbi:MAG: hypothetical protein Q8N51_02010 [Gammaproteobacteria bacterium]|nr:hypothetical protein [Gammaproteobacteria bacterium]
MAKTLPGMILLALVAGGCVHLPPEVKAEMERSTEPASNNFAQDVPEQPTAAQASSGHASR